VRLYQYSISQIQIQTSISAMARVSSSNIPAESDMHAASASTSSSPTPSDASLSPSPSAPVIEHRNQAPGIPDRRKSVRPTSRSQSRHRGREARKSKASPLSMSLANMGNAMKLRDDDEEDETPGEKSVGDVVCVRMLEHMGPMRANTANLLTTSRTPSKMPLTHPERPLKRKRTQHLQKIPSPRVWESRAQAPRSPLAKRQRKPSTRTAHTPQQTQQWQIHRARHQMCQQRISRSSRLHRPP